MTDSLAVVLSAAAGFTLNPRYLQAAAGLTMVFFVAWALAVARAVQRSPGT